ncbi:hypothetical protein P691DRAFT_776255 [Macrolepiota fuliginosa MF-IS2]|uniref:Uncharacterized protein n=1 Tax=Macrolepiota fuliginosa MF-IS2 TaxID=1400762 RepID=A0A9P6C325_9AGAR|nr:hypothetical protein P691DRAFT_776255 [Macrolepiota fuliginosa MF-IS2]
MPRRHANATAPSCSTVSSNATASIHSYSTVSSNGTVSLLPCSTAISNATVPVYPLSTVSSNATASASARPSSNNSNIPYRVVIVRPKEMHLDTSSNPHVQSLFQKDALQWLKNEKLAVIQNNTDIEYHFIGTGVAVVGVTYDGSHPPVPTQFLPRWTCFVDGNNTDQSNTPFHSHGESTNIPADGKTRICQKYSLPPGNHTLRISIEVPQVPAFFHSIRYQPMPKHNDTLDNALVRIDPRDPTSITNGSWTFDPEHKVLRPDKNGTNTTGIEIKFKGNALQWFSGPWETELHNLTATLDGNSTGIIKTHGHDNSGPLFAVSATNQSSEDHTLVITGYDHRLSLDHLLVTNGNPPVVALAVPTSKHPVSKAVLIGSIVGGVLGLFLLLAIAYVLIRWIRRRRRRQSWKDSALPSAISYPASRVSSRSSFSREVVTGDIEYNPEAQKKMESAGNAQVTEPPAAVILHADSGMRIHLRTSEVPPSYTHF